jgi:predicted Rossmann fold flavoprotein
MSEVWDVVVLGAGGAGMMCAATAARRGRKTLALDHGDKLGKKILISGGGRCNFTNIGAAPRNYFSGNEHFAKSAMARYRPQDFVALVEKHSVPYYEKKLGQLFCHDSAQRIVDLLEAECREAGAEIRLRTKIIDVEPIAREGESGPRYRVLTEGGQILAESVVVATGGPSVPKIGATDFGQRLAARLGLEVTQLDAALVSLTMDQKFTGRFGGLSGVSVDAEVSVGGEKFRENILFTHTGLSGPAILQVSLHWFPGEKIRINLSPDRSVEALLLGAKKEGSQKLVRNVYGELFTERLTEKFCEEFEIPATPIAQTADITLRKIAERTHRWELIPASNGGYGKAEVTRGGVHTDELSSRSLEAKKRPGLFFIGEVVDVTGWLGGYNFQWAWASGTAAGLHA